MTESQFSSKLLRALRAAMPQAVIFKISDRFTSGIPDFVVIHEGLATWFELKVKNNKPTLIQWETLRRLRRGYLVKWHAGYGAYLHVVTSMNEASKFVEGPFVFSKLIEHIVSLCRCD